MNDVMNVAVGLKERCSAVEVELDGVFVDRAGRRYAPGAYRFDSEIELKPEDASGASFAVEGMTIGIGFHWERQERQVFRGGLRLLNRDGLTLINDVPIEEYVTSVISSEMSAACPIELLKAHAVISRSWLIQGRARPDAGGAEYRDGEILRWYGREAHRDFDVCADDHCQRYQGITKAHSPAVAAAVRATAGQALTCSGNVCDTRFSKCCGGITEEYRSAWDEREVPYLASRYDGEGDAPPMRIEDWILSESVPAYCNTRDARLLAQILPGFDQETHDFYRWTVRYTPEEVGELVRSRTGEDLGTITGLQPLERGPSGRIVRLRIEGRKKSLVIGKELEIRRALSQTHLYSSAFVVLRAGADFVLKGAGWGHGVGLCQIGAAVMASMGKSYEEILRHYYRGAEIGA